jgi:hypothetical protein
MTRWGLIKNYNGNSSEVKLVTRFKFVADICAALLGKTYKVSLLKKVTIDDSFIWVVD